MLLLINLVIRRNLLQVKYFLNLNGESGATERMGSFCLPKKVSLKRPA